VYKYSSIALYHICNLDEKMGSFLLKSTLALLLLINGSSSEPSYANSHSNERRGRDRIANVEEETRSLDQIYQAALAEGGRVSKKAGLITTFSVNLTFSIHL
jgi:hypothetical protein